MIRFKQKAATRYQQVPDPEDYSGWLFLMQHHGLPTRLLDWTESPLIASLFAVLGKCEVDGCIWALSPIELNARQFHGEYIGRGLVHPDRLSNFFEIPFQEDEVADPIFKKVIALLTTEINPRMLQQQSVFTLHGTNTPLDQLPDHNFFLQSFTIPATAKELIFKNLLWLGIRESNLFPDLDHLAADICRTIGRTS